MTTSAFVILGIVAGVCFGAGVLFWHVLNRSRPAPQLEVPLGGVDPELDAELVRLATRNDQLEPELARLQIELARLTAANKALELKVSELELRPTPEAASAASFEAAPPPEEHVFSALTQPYPDSPEPSAPPAPAMSLAFEPPPVLPPVESRSAFDAGPREAVSFKSVDIFGNSPSGMFRALPAEPEPRRIEPVYARAEPARAPEPAPDRGDAVRRPPDVEGARRMMQALYSDAVIAQENREALLVVIARFLRVAEPQARELGANAPEAKPFALLSLIENDAALNKGQRETVLLLYRRLAKKN